MPCFLFVVPASFLAGMFLCSSDFFLGGGLLGLGLNLCVWVYGIGVGVGGHAYRGVSTLQSPGGLVLILLDPGHGRFLIWGL